MMKRFSFIRLAISILILLISVYVAYVVFPKSLQKDFHGLNVDTSRSSIELDEILLGGVGKDGIPAITNPAFISIENSVEKDDVRGILIKIDEVRKWYPYSILVWHEIVNDNIGENHYSVTFCPLCASAIAYDREINGEVLEFKVSGLLYESNLLMYDTKTESLWSQSRGEAVVGDYLGTKLELIDIQVIKFEELKRKYKDVLVLSRDTGHLRDYNYSPYGEYEKSEDLLFTVGEFDERLPTKALVYVVKDEDRYVAFQHSEIKEGFNVYYVGEDRYRLERQGDEIRAEVNKKALKGYYELWFSFAVNHKEDGVLAERAKGGLKLKTRFKSSDDVKVEKTKVNSIEIESLKFEVAEVKALSGEYLDYSERRFDETAEAGKKHVLFFHAGWCPFCRKADSNIKSELNSIPSDVIIYKVDYDTNKDLRLKYGVQYQHTFVQVDETKKGIKKFSGSADLDSILSNLRR